MQELIDRLRAATGPDRELDKEIIFATFPKNRVAVFDGIKHISTMTGADGEPWFGPLADRDDCPAFTNSFDEAITLLPDGMAIIDLTLSWDTCKERGHPAATIRWYPPKTPDTKDWHARVVTAKTIPLTACLAALEARAALSAAKGHGL